MARRSVGSRLPGEGEGFLGERTCGTVPERHWRRSRARQASHSLQELRETRDFTVGRSQGGTYRPQARPLAEGAGEWRGGGPG